MNINYSILISACSAVVAACASVVTVLNYRLSRKLANENKLYEEKIRSYHVVIKALNEASARYLDCAGDYLTGEEKGNGTKELFDTLNDELDKSFYALEDAIYENSLVIPDKIMRKIYHFLDLLDMDEFLNEMLGDGRLEEFEDSINVLFDKIINAMRKDLSFEKLDIGLKKRISGK